jgi:hypothetical protein
MKVSAFFIALCFFTSNAFAQVTITTNDLPDAGDVLVQFNAVLQGEPDIEDTGENFTWNYDGDIVNLTGTSTTTNCFNVDDTPIVFQFLFNNPFNPEHNSDYGIGVEDFDLAGFVTVTDAYQYYQNRSDRFAITGFGASLNSIPAGAQSTPVDVIYELPMTYGDSHESFSEATLEAPTLFTYRQQQTRVSEVDGWGTLNILGASYDVIRVRAVLNGADSIYVNQFSFGFNLPRPEIVEYKWISPLFKTPVLQIQRSNGVNTSVLVADLPTNVRENELNQLSVYPNPSSDVIRVNDVSFGTPFQIINTAGQQVLSGNIADGEIDVRALPQGLYFLQINSENTVSSAKLTIVR